MSKRLVLRLVLPVVSALAACASPAPEEQTSSTHADIIGGTADSGDPAVVGVVPQSDDTSATCTGEIIAPTIVLTAAHCVTASLLGFTPTSIAIVTDPDITAFFGGKGDSSKVFAATTATTHPQYNPDTGANDLAIIELDRATNIKPLSFNRSASAMKKLDGKNGRAIGYGVTVDGDSNTANHKRQATLGLSEITAASFLAISSSATQCHGDSGGPVLAKIGGVDTIVGIGWRTVADDGTCGQGVLDTRVDPYADFIDSFLQGNSGKSGKSGDSKTAPGGGDVSCCVNGAAFACPTVAACLGGFDVNACMKACASTSCIVACAEKASTAKPPTKACVSAGSCS